MTLTTERLVLRPLNADDLHTMHAYAGDREITRYMLDFPSKTLAETEQFLAWAVAEWASDHPASYEFAITLDGRHIGAISLNVDAQRQEGELGWILHKNAQGRGYATEAALAVKHFATTRLKMKRLVAHCDSRNSASENLMKAIGLQLVTQNGTRQYPDGRGCAGDFTYALELA